MREYRLTPKLTRINRVRQRLAYENEMSAVISNMTPREIYSGLLFIGRVHHYKPGWVKHAFHELYGKWPKPLSPVEPERPPVELEAWVALRKKKPIGTGMVRTRRPQQTIPTTDDELQLPTNGG